MLHDPEIVSIFRKNMVKYQMNINKLVLFVCMGCSFFAIVSLLVANLTSIINIPYKAILLLAICSIIDLSITPALLWIIGKRLTEPQYVKIYKFTLLFCACAYYLSLVLLIPMKQMWSNIFFMIFLSSFFFDWIAVIYVSILLSFTCIVAYIYQPVFAPQDVQELSVRIISIFFCTSASLIITILSRNLVWKTSKKQYELKTSLIEVEQRNKVAEGLRDMMTVLNSDRSLDEVLEFIVRQASNLVDSDACALYKLNPEKNILTIQTSIGLPEEFLHIKDYPADIGPMGTAVKKRQAVHVTDFNEIIQRYKSGDLDDRRATWVKENVMSMLVVPLIFKEVVYGGINFLYLNINCNSCCRCTFSDEKIKLATAFADQAALVIDNARLRKETKEVAVEAERNRLARDLHDAVTQTLFSASLIAEVLPKIWDRNQDEGRKRLFEIRDLSRGALAEMRALLLELRPSTLIETFLSDLLRHLSEAATGRSRIPVKLNCGSVIHLPVDVKIGFYRIAQEALNNIVKHSRATSATLELSDISQEGTYAVLLRISDNGKGFKENEISGDHIGLGIMHERATSINAVITITSTIGIGTIVEVIWSGELKEESYYE